MKDNLIDFIQNIRWSIDAWFFGVCDLVERLRYWIPIIIKDRDFDYDFTLRILRHKLLRLQNNMEQHNNRDNTSIVDEIAHTIELLDISTGRHPDYEYKDSTTRVQYEEIRKLRIKAREEFWKYIGANIHKWWD